MIYAYSTELAHHGIKGQKWGVRRFQNEDGTLTEAGKKRHEKIMNSGNAKYVYKHRKELSDEEFDYAYNKAKKNHDLKQMIKEDRSPAQTAAIEVGKTAAKAALVAAAVVGTYAVLTKTEMGRNAVASGKQKVKDILKDAAIDAVKATKNTTETAAKAVAKAGTDAVKTAASSAATSAKQYKQGLDKAMPKQFKKGGAPMKALYYYGKTVDKILKK